MMFFLSSSILQRVVGSGSNPRSANQSTACPACGRLTQTLARSGSSAGSPRCCDLACLTCLRLKTTAESDG